MANNNNSKRIVANETTSHEDMHGVVTETLPTQLDAELLDAQVLRDEEVKHKNPKPPTTTFDITSPLEDRHDLTSHMRRPREGYHQTTKRDDEIESARRNGYTFIREQELFRVVEDENGKRTKVAVPFQKPGNETGPIMRLAEGRNREGFQSYLYAMEIPQNLVDQHLRAISFRSHGGLKEQKSILKQYVDGANSRIGRREEITVKGDGYEEGLEQHHSGRAG